MGWILGRQISPPKQPAVSPLVHDESWYNPDQGAGIDLELPWWRPPTSPTFGCPLQGKQGEGRQYPGLSLSCLCETQGRGWRPQSFDDEAVPYIMSNMSATCHFGLRWLELKHGTSARPAAAFNDNFRLPPAAVWGSQRGNWWDGPDFIDGLHITSRPRRG